MKWQERKPKKRPLRTTKETRKRQQYSDTARKRLSEELHTDRRTEIAVSSRGSQTRKGEEIQSTEEALRPKQKGKNGESGARQTVGENRERKICETKDRNQKEISDSDNGLPTNKERVGSNQKEVQPSVCVLPQKTNEVGDRPRDAIIAKGETYSGERSPGLSELQRSKRKSFGPKMGGGGTSFIGHKGNFKANGEPINPNQTRNKRSVWTVPTKPFKEAHFATFPQDLIIPMVKAGCPENGIVLDPFMGSGTTAYVARSLGRNFLGIELNGDYIKLAEKRLAQQTLI